MSALLAILLAAGSAPDLTIVTTGDNGGEVAPCGCAFNPTGGLAKRKTSLTALEKKGPVLVLDAGNALFQPTGVNDEKKQERAAFILRTMAALGTKAMAVGIRDLNAGYAWLKKEAAASKVTLLSANLMKDGALLFEPSTVVTVGTRKIGVIGVSPFGPMMSNDGVKGEPGFPLVLAEAKKLREQKVELIVVLVATNYSDALGLSNDLKGEVDVLVQSGEPRGLVPAQPNAGNFILSGGQKGQLMGTLELELDGSGPFFDLTVVKRDKELLKGLDGRVAELVTRRKATTDPAAQKDLDKLIKDIKARREEQRKKADVVVDAKSRTLKFDWVVLGTDVADDKAIKAEVLKYEPTYKGAHP